MCSSQKRKLHPAVQQLRTLDVLYTEYIVVLCVCVNVQVLDVDIFNHLSITI